MQSHARVVVVGGGMMGAGLLYHLAEEGWTDSILVEKAELTSGSTWHAAGQCPSFIADYNMAKVHHYGNTLYPKLEEMTGQYTSWHGCGGIRFATTKEELDWFKHVEGMAKLIGYRMEIIGPNEIKRINPFVDVEGVIAGAWTTGRRPRRSGRLLQRAGQGRARHGRLHRAPQPGARHQARQRRVAGRDRAGDDHLRARGQRRRLLRPPGRADGRHRRAHDQHGAHLPGHRADQGVPRARRGDAGHARPLSLGLLPPGAEGRPDRHLRDPGLQGVLGAPRRLARVGLGERALRGRLRAHRPLPSSGCWSACRSGRTPASSGSSAAPFPTRPTTTR